METSSSNSNPNDDIKELLKEADLIINKYRDRDPEERNTSLISIKCTKTSVNEAKAACSSNDNDPHSSTSKNLKISKIRNEIDNILKNLDPSNGNDPHSSTSKNPIKIRNEIDNLLTDIDSRQLTDKNKTADQLKKTIDSIIVKVDEDLNTTSTAISSTQNATNTANLQSNNDDVIFISESTSEIISLLTPIRNVKRVRQANEVIVINDSFNEISRPSPEKLKKLDSTAKQNGTFSKSSNNSISVRHEAILKCAICLQSSVDKMPTSTPCGHIYCLNCIKMALDSTSKCPLCNKKLRKRQLVKLYP